MRVLLVKMSSMGDLIHTLPALTDAMQAIPNLEIDWVVEPAFADIPAMHPAVKKIILFPLRKWRKAIWKSARSPEVKNFFAQLRNQKYDAIIDAQGLLKSAIVAKVAKGDIHGYDKNSAREFMSSFFYKYKYAASKKEHAIERARQLFANALKYPLPKTKPHFNIDANKLPRLDFELPKKYFVFLHGTTWETKHYPESYWKILIGKADQENIPVFLLWGNETEKNRAMRLAENTKHVKVLPSLSILQIASLLKKATAVVTVDTGLGHLCAALETTPTIGLYGPTDPKRVGIVGDNQHYLSAQFVCAPCYSKTCFYAKKHHTEIVPSCYVSINPEIVWKKLEEIICQTSKPNSSNF